MPLYILSYLNSVKFELRAFPKACGFHVERSGSKFGKNTKQILIDFGHLSFRRHALLILTFPEQTIKSVVVAFCRRFCPIVTFPALFYLPLSEQCLSKYSARNLKAATSLHKLALDFQDCIYVADTIEQNFVVCLISPQCKHAKSCSGRQHQALKTS